MKPAQHVSWFVEPHGVVVSSHGSVCLSIHYPHAGLWALIANGNYSEARGVEMTSVLMSISRQEAELEVEKTLAAWTQAGLLSKG